MTCQIGPINNLEFNHRNFKLDFHIQVKIFDQVNTYVFIGRENHFVVVFYQCNVSPLTWSDGAEEEDSKQP